MRRFLSSGLLQDINPFTHYSYKASRILYIWILNLMDFPGKLQQETTDPSCAEPCAVIEKEWSTSTFFLSLEVPPKACVFKDRKASYFFFFKAAIKQQ